MKKETVGKQLYDKIVKEADQKAPETREVTLKYGEKFLKKLESIIQSEKYKTWPKVWILVIGKKEILSEHLVRIRLAMLKDKPPMQLHCMLYSYEPSNNRLLLHWCLPQSSKIAQAIVANHDGFDPLYVDSCRKYLNLK
jgi:hypothetical protein